MFHLPLPLAAGAFSLDIHPRWHDLSWVGQVGLAGLCVVPVILVLWLYRYEMRLVRRPAALGLLALRLVAILLLVCLICLQPILAHSSTEELSGRVLIAVDRSDSMDVADPQRPAVDKLRLALALHLSGDLCPDAQLLGWIEQYAREGAPPWTAAAAEPEDSDRRRQLVEARRRHDLVCARVDTLTRSAVAERLLSPDGVQLLSQLAARHPVELLGFDGSAWDVKPEQLKEWFHPPAAEAGVVQGGPPQPPGHAQQTDLNQPLRRALERSGPGRGKYRGIVLLTDGQHNQGPEPVQKAKELGGQHIPVYPLALGDRQAPADVALLWVKAPPSAPRDAVVPIEARFRVTGLGKQDIRVTLQRPGQPPLQERALHHDGRDGYHSVRFEARLEGDGKQQQFLVAAPPLAEEKNTANNRQQIDIQVEDDRAKVLAIDSQARWDYQYLVNDLLRDPGVQLQRVLFDPPLVREDVSDADLEKLGNAARRLPAGPDALAAFACIILGDVSPAQLPLADRLRLEAYVARQGGTLVLVGGKRFLPLAFTALGPDQKPGKDAASLDPLLKLLPIEGPRVVKPAEGFPVTLTPEGQRTPFLQLEAEPGASERRWRALPRHYWGIIGRAKPAATTLAYVRDDGMPPAAGKDPEEREERLRRERALIVRQSYGNGQVLWVGLDSTWRWRYKVGDTYHHRFLGQVIRWAASDRVRFGTRKPVYEQGQEAEVVLEKDVVGDLPPNVQVAARVVRLEDGGREEQIAVVPLRPSGNQRTLEGRLRVARAGRYAMELTVSDPAFAAVLLGPRGAAGQGGKRRTTFLVTPPESAEMLRLETNEPLLQELANVSGGRVFHATDAAELVSLLSQEDARQQAETDRTEHKLWQSWWTLLLFLGLVTAEWVGRKWAGLP